MPATGSVQRLPFPMRRTDYSPLPLPCLRRTVWAFTGQSARASRLLRPLLTSAARSTPITRCPVRTLRRRRGDRPPEVSSTAFSTQPADHLCDLDGTALRS